MDIPSRNRPKKALQLAQEIQTRLDGGMYRSRLPGIDVLANELQVNRKTVNRAILHLVKEGVLVRRSGYGTFIAGTEPEDARAPRRKNTRRYAFMITVKEGYLGYLSVLEGCDQAVSTIGGSVLFTRFDEDAPADQLLGRLRALQVEGVIVCSTISSRMLDELRREFNVVLVDYTPPYAQANAVLWDNYAGGRMVAERLADKGVRKIHLLAINADPREPRYNPASNHGRRAEGVLEAAADRHLACRLHATDWLLENLNPDHPLGHELRSAGEDEAFVIVDNNMVVPALNRLGAMSAAGRLWIGAFDRKNRDIYRLPGVYAEMDMHLLGHEAATMLIDILGRASRRVRREVLMPDISETPKTEVLAYA